MRTFVPADPEGIRLLTAVRAVLGVGLGAGAAAVAGFPLSGVVAAGLAALLALFTVADATVRRQAATTALLPAAGLPALALAAAVHPAPPARAAAFLAVVFAGAYARRWGPRGHAVGVFAFMMFFLAQVLHPSAQELPRLCAAVGTGLAAAALTRFAAFPVPPAPAPAAPAPYRPPGRLRPTTRQALQATAACAAALAAGHALSPERWYWAVGSAWWCFVNTSSAGETVVRSFRRMLGTAAGIVAGLAVALPVHGAPGATAALLALCVFGIFYTAPVSYSAMMFFVTLLVGLLYGALGALGPGLLALRLQETGIGAGAAVLAVLTVAPVTTHAVTDAHLRRAVEALRRFRQEHAAPHGAPADPAAAAAELERHLHAVRLAAAPLLHPGSPLRARRERALRALADLESCAAQLRALGASDDDRGVHRERALERLRACEAALEALCDPAHAPRPVLAA